MEFMKELQSFIDDHQIYHSEFQMDNFITKRNGGTLYGQYKQALRELFKRKRGLVQLFSDRERMKIDMDELDHDINNADINQFEIRRKQVDLKEKQIVFIDLEKNIGDTEREFRRFFGQAKALKMQIGEITPERRKVLDQQMWEHNLKQMAALDFMTSGRLSPNTIEFMMSTPVEWRRPILKYIKEKKGELVEWYENQEVALPKIEKNTVELIKLMEPINA